MSEVRLRARMARSRRAREIQGMLAMQGLGLEETEAEGKEATAVMERPATARIPRRSVGRTAATMDAIRPLPYRTVLASWPDDWRERWGRRANDLEDSGLSWRDAEGRAFLEIWNQLRATTQVERN